MFGIFMLPYARINNRFGTFKAGLKKPAREKDSECPFHGGFSDAIRKALANESRFPFGHARTKNLSECITRLSALAT